MLRLFCDLTVIAGGRISALVVRPGALMLIRGWAGRGYARRIARLGSFSAVPAGCLPKAEGRVRARRARPFPASHDRPAARRDRVDFQAQLGRYIDVMPDVGENLRASQGLLMVKNTVGGADIARAPFVRAAGAAHMLHAALRGRTGR